LNSESDFQPEEEQHNRIDFAEQFEMENDLRPSKNSDSSEKPQYYFAKPGDLTVSSLLQNWDLFEGEAPTEQNHIKKLKTNPVHGVISSPVRAVPYQPQQQPSTSTTKKRKLDRNSSEEMLFDFNEEIDLNELL
jgi:hypothetical protein